MQKVSACPTTDAIEGGAASDTNLVANAVMKPDWPYLNGAISKRMFGNTGTRMKREIEITVGDLSGPLDRFERHGSRA